MVIYVSLVTEGANTNSPCSGLSSDLISIVMKIQYPTAPVAVKRPRGRPRSFDRDQALARAMQVFWEKGYEAASMQDLLTAMEISSPSLYAAFGDKEALFLEAVQR